jgi:hypothetical protein
MDGRHLHVEREVDGVDDRDERALERVALRVDLVAALHRIAWRTT